jgi:hypothetical protein
MNAVTLIHNEFRLLLRSLFARVVVGLTVVLAVYGMRAVDHSDNFQFRGMGRTSYTMSLGAAQYSAYAGAALFAMLTLLALSRDRRQQSRALIDAAAGYGPVLAARVAALLGLALATALLGLIVALAAHRFLAAAPWEMPPYLFSVGLILLPALGFAILIAAALDLAFENLDIAFLTFGTLYFFGFTSPNYLLRWVQTSASVYSDFGGIEPVGRLVVYNRLFWLCLTAGVVLLAFWLRRRPGCSRGAALLRNWGRGLIPAAALVVLLAAAGVYTWEPYLFPADSALRRDLPRAPQIRLEAVECHAELQPHAKSLAVEARYVFAKDSAPAGMEFVTNAGLRIDTLTLNGADAAWQRVPGTDRIEVELPLGERAEVHVRYHGCIRYPGSGSLAGYITDRSVYLLENSHWLFEPLTQARAPIQVTGSVTAPAYLTVIPPGRLESTKEEGKRRTWRFAAACPKLALGLFAGEYRQETFQVGSAAVEFYFSPRHETYIRAAKVTDRIRDILRFYQEQIGPFPFEDMPLKIVETSVYKPGGHSSLNVVTMAEYLLNRTRVSDPNTDPRYILRDLQILAHELSHQWWGSGVAIEERGPWSCEGLAEYTTYQYLAARCPDSITHNVPRGWRGSLGQSKHAWWRKDPRALERMRPALRERLLLGQAKGQAYNTLPVRLLDAEERIGKEAVRTRLAEVFRRYCGRTLDPSGFLAVMGPEAIAPDWDKMDSEPASGSENCRAILLK